MEDDTDSRFNEPHFLALGYLTDAVSYRNAAQSLDTDPNNVTMFSPIYFLSCHAMELLLKACIVAKTASTDGLRAHKVRHNLDELRKQAVEVGLKLDRHSHAVIDMLAPYHADHSFRYRKTGYKSFPLTEEVRRAVDDIMNATAPIVHHNVHAAINRQRSSSEPRLQ